MGPGLHTYPWLVIKTAWRHSFHATHSIILALIMLAGLVTYFLPTVEVMVDLHGWQVATLVLGGVIAVRLFLSPYWFWKEDQKRLATLSGQIETEAEIKQKHTDGVIRTSPRIRSISTRREPQMVGIDR
jgi:phosphate/sulfate permease